MRLTYRIKIAPWKPLQSDFRCVFNRGGGLPSRDDRHADGQHAGVWPTLPAPGLIPACGPGLPGGAGRSMVFAYQRMHTSACIRTHNGLPRGRNEAK
jgi:hypothetical protein